MSECKAMTCREVVSYGEITQMHAWWFSLDDQFIDVLARGVLVIFYLIKGVGMAKLKATHISNTSSPSAVYGFHQIVVDEAFEGLNFGKPFDEAYAEWYKETSHD